MRSCLQGVLVAVALLLAADAAAQAASWATISIAGADGRRSQWAVELALSPAQRTRGLMGRTRLAAGQGMWFDFGEPRHVEMWMKDTLVALDMVFVAADGRVVHVASHTTPLSLARIAAGEAVRYVLEIGAGEANRCAIERGSRVMLPPLPVAAPQR